MPEYGPFEAELFGEIQNKSDTTIENSELDSLNIEQHNNSAETLRRIEGTLGAQFAMRCLEGGVITSFDDGYSTFRVEDEKLEELIEQHRGEAEAYWAEVDQISKSVELPTINNLAENARLAMRDAIEVLFSSEVIEKGWLVESSKFAGPGNTHGLGAEEWSVAGFDEHAFGQIDYTNYVLDLYDRDQWTGALPTPLSKKERDDKIKVSINYSPRVLNSQAAFYQQAIEVTGRTSTPEQILHLPLIAIAAHEYGHALERAYIAHGSKTFEKSPLQAVMPVAYYLPSSEQENVHRELFARTIEQEVLIQQLQEAYNFSEEELTRFKDSLYGQQEAKSDSYIALFEYGRQLDVWPNNLYLIIAAINNKFREIGDTSVFPLAPDVITALQYRHKPYTLDQVKALQPELPEYRNSR